MQRVGSYSLATEGPGRDSGTGLGAGQGIGLGDRLSGGLLDSLRHLGDRPEGGNPSVIVVNPMLQSLGFAAFLLWLLQMPRAALTAFSHVYGSSLLAALPFLGFLLAFALLARSRKLPRIHLTMAVLSGLAAAMGLGLLFTYSNAAALALLVALELVAAYGLVAWGSVLRNMTLMSAVLLAFLALACGGLLQLVAAAGALLSGLGNVRLYAQGCLTALVLLPLLNGLYFLRTASSGDERLAFSRQQASWNPGINWRNSDFAPFIVILLAGSVLLGFVRGFIYSPYMFSVMQIDAVRGLGELLLAALVVLAVRYMRRPLASSLVLALMAALVFGILALAPLLLSQTGILFAQGLLGALGDALFAFALVFCVSPANRSRTQFFPRLLVAVLCSGYLWCFGLGGLAKAQLGYDPQLIAALGAVALAIIALLLAAATVQLVLQAGAFGRGRGGADETGGAGAWEDGLQAEADSRDSALEEAAEILAEGAEDADAAGGADGAPAADAAAADAASAKPKRRRKSGLTAKGGLSDKEAEAIAFSVIDEIYCKRLEPYCLTKRETQVSLLAIRGYNNAACARALDISESTVKLHLSNAYHKCKVTGRIEMQKLVADDNERE